MSVVLITGGSRGIGRALVQEFSKAGYAIAFTYASNENAANSVVDFVRAQGGSALAFQANVRDYDRAGEVVSAAQEQLGPINALVNNAGIKRDGPFMKMSPADWLDLLDTNLT
jgi:3-oxoacyl-[acyl-carrier protein] reductase